MTAATTIAPPTATAARLLAGDDGTGRALGLDEHLALHGPLPHRGTARRGSVGPLVSTVDAAGLRGRGGGWFPTARKLRAVADASGQARRRPVVVGNGMEGEPASGKDAVLLSRSPHLVLDGLELAAEAVGSREVYLAVHRGSPVLPAVEHALAERRSRARDRVEITLVTPPERYVASEESALSQYVGRGVALPTSGPRPFERGVSGRPTLVQNVETLAHLALLARHGADWFRSLGTAEAPGTALVTVGGAVGAPGVVEVAVGTPITEVLQRCGGPTGSPQALLTGGYGGAWVGPAAADAPWSPEGLAAVGGVIGAGVLLVLPDTACGLAETARVATWMAGESAGQCGPCRFGLPSVAEDLAGLAARGRSDVRDLQRLRGRLGLVTGRGACRHPDGTARLVGSALRVFEADVVRHTRGTCSAGHRHGWLPVPAGRPVPVPAAGREFR
ncbi:MAG: NADH-ubiquinone oxidoreductase-F iron-sulfur binding region domain-containing protein [Candidatus Nanopelagicales bacterium]